MPDLSATDAFCLQIGVEARVQRGVFGPTTNPKGTQLVDFMGLRASQIQAALWNAGHEVTVPSGGNPIDNSDDAGKTIERLTRTANEFLAAGDVIFASDPRHDQETPQAAVTMWREGSDIMKTLIMFVKKFVTKTDRSATGTGGIDKSDFAEIGHDKEQRVSEQFNLDTLW